MILFILSGPSGVGKTTVIEELLSKDFHLRYSVSHTTRDKRNGERDGKDYYFVSEEEFSKMRSRGDFLEWAKVFGDFYGTSKGELNKASGNDCDLIMDLDVQGAQQVRERLLDQRAVYIFLAPPSKESLKARFDSRNTESMEERDRRMQVAEREMNQAKKFDYLVVNKNLEDTIMKVESIVRAERCRIT